MRVRTEHSGRQLPFERERRLVLQRLPEGAVITRAVLTVSPYSADPQGRFIENITFPGAVGDWGAQQNATPGAVEIDLHARRKLAALVGTNLDGGTLLVDLGAGYLAVDPVGGIGGTGSFPVVNATELPGLTVTGLRVVAATPAAHPTISVLRVASPPSNVSLAIAGGPVFFTHFGDLVQPVTTPDFAAVLQAMLSTLKIENGHYVVPLVVHSDTIARLDLEFDVEFTVAVSGMPDGLASVQAPYRYDGTAVAGPDGLGGGLSVSVPPGMVAVAGGTAGRVQGAFDSTRVVFGPLTGVSAAEPVPVASSGPLAQPFVPAGTEIASSVDLLLTAVTAQVRLVVDVVEDLDGKPGRTSLLDTVSELTLTRDEAGSPTWINVPLAHEVEFLGGTRRWLVLQARDGTAVWNAGPAAPAAAAPSTPAAAAPSAGSAGPDPGLHQTRDGGLSWRAVIGPAGSGPLAAPLRLRHRTTSFHMPLELRVGSGAAETAVSLQRFAPQGAVDVRLDFPEVAEAFNTALAASAAPTPAAEHVANGDFRDWYRIGTTVRHAGSLTPASIVPPIDGTVGALSSSSARALAAFGPAGDTVYLAERRNGAVRFLAFDVFCRDQLLDTTIGPGDPVAMVVDRAGQRALVASSAPALVVVDTATGRPVGVPVQTAAEVLDLAVSADGSGVYLLHGSESGTSEISTSETVYRVSWTTLLAAAGGAALDWGEQPSAALGGQPRAIAVGPDGRVFVVTDEETTVVLGDGPDTASSSRWRLHRFLDGTALSMRDSVPVAAEATAADVTVTPSGGHVLVLGWDLERDQDTGWLVRASDLGAVTSIALPAGMAARCLAVDPAGELALVAQIEQQGEGPGAGLVEIIDLRRRALLPDSQVRLPATADAACLAMSPTGTHVVATAPGLPGAVLLTIGDAQPVDWQLTAGSVRPLCLPTTGEVLALLGVPLRAKTGTVATADITSPAVLPSAISQVVPATGATRYRFAFDGFTDAEGAVGQLIWRTGNCATGRTDQVPVTSLAAEPGLVRDVVPAHELVVTSPPGATQAEIRFFTPEGALAVDRVSLAGSANIVSRTWQPSVPTITVRPSAAGLTVSNGAPAAAAISQVIASPGGQDFDLRLAARVAAGAEPPAVRLAFFDDDAAAVGDVVRLDLDPSGFDDRAASGQVPAGAVEAELRVEVPPGGSVELAELSLVIGARTEVGLRFVSAAPGELTTRDVAVQLDRAEPRAAGLPTGGLCPATPPATESGVAESGADGCFCGPCGRSQPVKRQVHTRTPAGRPASVTVCPACGAQRVRLGGRPVAYPEPSTVPGFRVPDRAATSRGGPAIVARLRVDAPLTAISGIGAVRSAELSDAGFPTVLALSEAAAGTVAAVPGISDRQAGEFIAEAARLVREHGVHTIFPD